MTREQALAAIVARFKRTLLTMLVIALVTASLALPLIALRTYNVWVEPSDCGVTVRWGWYASGRGDSGGWRWCSGVVTDAGDGHLILRLK